MILDRIKKFLRNSSFVHIKQEDFNTLHGAVAVIDRFLDDRVRYPLEWDDFISWKNSNPTIERARLSIFPTEPMLLSRDREKIAAAGKIICEERNRLAALCGVPAREEPEIEL